MMLVYQILSVILLVSKLHAKGITSTMQADSIRIGYTYKLGDWYCCDLGK